MAGQTITDCPINLAINEKSGHCHQLGGRNRLWVGPTKKAQGTGHKAKTIIDNSFSPYTLRRMPCTSLAFTCPHRRFCFAESSSFPGLQSAYWLGLIPADVLGGVQRLILNRGTGTCRKSVLYQNRIFSGGLRSGTYSRGIFPSFHS